MANRALSPPIEGESRIGDGRPNIQGIWYIQAGTSPGKGSILAMDAVANDGTITTYYLFIGSDGKIRTASTEPTNTNTDGSVVGGQS
jgi:hypothetical protein